MKLKDKLKYCTGCHDNCYNCAEHSGAKDGLCWNLHNAKVVWRKEVHKHQRPPWKQKAERLLDCYHRPGYYYLKPNVTE